MTIANKARRILINIGKTLPFIVCFIVMLSYIEATIAIYRTNYLLFHDYVTLDKPISQLIGCYFEYDWVHVFVLTIISFAVETCKWNKISVLYLALHLAFKHYISQFELEPTTIYIICIINIVIISFLCYKGVKQLIK